MLDGEVEIVRGAQARTTTLATFVPGAVFSEGVMLDDSPHASSAVTRQGATVWQVRRAVLEQARAEKPEVFYRIVGRIAARLSDRLRFAAERIAGEKSATVVSAVRTEHDSLGEREVPDHAYYGVQTIRGMENFPLSGIRDASLRALHPRARLCEESRRDRRTPNSACSMPRRPTRS